MRAKSDEIVAPAWERVTDMSGSTISLVVPLGRDLQRLYEHTW
jgi:hypothetical protein